jgi:phage-related protein
MSLWDRARSVGGAVVSGVRAIGSAAVDAAGDLLAMGRDALMALVRRIAPDFLPLFEGDGIAGFIRRLIQRGLRALFDGLTAPLRGILNIGGLGARVSQAISWLGTIAGQLANNDCSGILAAARRVRGFFEETLGPVIDKIKSIADKVSGFFSGIWESVTTPIMDVLRRIGGELWASLRGFVRDVGQVIRRVREGLGVAWSRVKGWLGIRAEEGEEEGGGLWGWIKEKAEAIGKTVSDAVRPILGPLRKVGAGLLMLIPGGQLAAIILLWPELRQAFDWVSRQWQQLRLIPRARAFLANTVLPALINGAERVAQAFLSGADWLLGLLDRVSGALAEAVGAASGMFAPLGAVIRIAQSGFHTIITWVRSGLRYVSRNFRSLARRVIAFARRVLEALLQLISIVANPFGIVGFLAGTLWRLLPDCLKGPIIDFILELIIALVRAMPPNPMLGFLWTVIKTGVLGFLERVLSFSTERKVTVSNKLAKIVSGMSPGFFIGYLKGLVIGLWRGIVGPFQAIGAIFDLPAQIQAFLSNLGLRLCDLVEQIRCFAVQLASRVFGSLDQILQSIGELLENPAKIVDLIRCAVAGALGAVRSLGAQMADQMMAILEGSEESIGQRLGEVAGELLLQAVISYFTAGAGAGLAVVQKISGALASVGKAIREVIAVLRGLLGKLISFIKGLASKLGSFIKRGAKSVLGKLGEWFGRVGAWFKKLFGRLAARIRKRFTLTAEERLLWTEFKGAVRALIAEHHGGITRRELARAYRGVLRRFPKVAKWPAFITKHGPDWRLWVRRVKSIRPRKVGHVLQDAQTRWKQGKKAVKKVIQGIKRRPGNIDAAQITAAIQRLVPIYRYKYLRAHFEAERNEFVVDGSMSPKGKVTATPPKRPTQNNVQVVSASKHVKVDLLVKRSATRSAPSGSPPHWSQVEVIKTRSGNSSLYIRGHIASGFFAGGGSTNLTPITRAANSSMAHGAETPVRRALPVVARASSRRPVFKYDVNMTGKGGGTTPKRKVRHGKGFVCAKIPAEAKLYRTINIKVEKFGYNPQSKKWDRKMSAPNPGAIQNVPPYPPGYKEPCK